MGTAPNAWWHHHTVICHGRLVRTVPLVTMESIHDDKKKSNRRRLVWTSPNNHMSKYFGIR